MPHPQGLTGFRLREQDRQVRAQRLLSSLIRARTVRPTFNPKDLISTIAAAAARCRSARRA